MSNALIIILGLAGAFLLLGGVAYSAYSRIRRMSQSGMRLSDLLGKLEESLEEEDAWKLPPEKRARGKRPSASAQKTDGGGEDETTKAD